MKLIRTEGSLEIGRRRQEKFFPGGLLVGNEALKLRDRLVLREVKRLPVGGMFVCACIS
jgi:hypothetical protein